MLLDVIKVEHKRDFILEITFEDGVNGAVDFSDFLKFEGIFQTLKNVDEFSKAFVNLETGTICWPNGADYSSDVLYSKITKQPIHIGPKQSA